MRPSRRRAAGTPSGLRGRPLLLVAVLLIVGSEWVQRPLSEHYWELYLESGEQPWLERAVQHRAAPHHRRVAR
ncbi:hypothetical protein ACWDRX_16070, partial [Streptomyces nigra]